jgi:methionyl-tRNA formyltransferase
MRVILLGRKPVACDALRFMLSLGVEVVAVSTPARTDHDLYPERLVDVADSFGVSVVQDQDLYDCLAGKPVGIDLRGVDLVVSILHQKRIRGPLLTLGRIGCVNFHPAPLPEYRGWGTYNIAVLEELKKWGASAHFADEGFDTGPLIRARWFDIDCSDETALSLQRKTQPVLLELFKEVFDLARRDGVLPSTPQGPGRSFTKREVMSLRFITATDPPELVERKVRAFWYPPNPCAEVQIGSKHYPIVNHGIFDDLVPLVCAQRLKETTISTGEKPNKPGV